MGFRQTVLNKLDALEVKVNAEVDRGAARHAAVDRRLANLFDLIAERSKGHREDHREDHADTLGAIRSDMTDIANAVGNLIELGRLEERLIHEQLDRIEALLGNPPLDRIQAKKAVDAAIAAQPPRFTRELIREAEEALYEINFRRGCCDTAAAEEHRPDCVSVGQRFEIVMPATGPSLMVYQTDSPPPGLGWLNLAPGAKYLFKTASGTYYVVEAGVDS